MNQKFSKILVKTSKWAMPGIMFIAGYFLLGQIIFCGVLDSLLNRR